ncbi:MAG: cyclic 2,3-diphosphoglycerate synthase, partial [Candidatus Micrarchaeaceae archaeon]
LILGAAGRDFHDFNMLFRDNESFEVVGFTANQIPFIADRMYPKELSGTLYKNGIKIYEEKELSSIIKKEKVDVCVLAYSDLPYNAVMHKASIANASGADFWLVAPEQAMLKSTKPVIAVCAVRTGSGKSQTSRYIAELVKKNGKKPVVIRHPMPYGDLKKQIVERFATIKDLDKYNCTIEEREDYEPHLINKTVVYAGVDYEKILRLAEKEADVIIWDGGNNDAPFIKPDLFITVADPLRAGNELTYYPGETVARLADVLIINKVNSASEIEIKDLKENLKSINPKAKILLADSLIKVDNANMIKDKKVLVIEDGPTVTHGGMAFGAATVAAKNFGAAEIVDAKKYAVGSIKEAYEKYPQLDRILPALGYSKKQIKELEETINKAECDSVVSATPTDLKHILNANKPIVHVSYELQPKTDELREIINNFVRQSVK